MASITVDVAAVKCHITVDSYRISLVTLLELGKVHHAAFFSGLLGGKYQQMRIQDFFGSHCKFFLIFGGHSLDECSRKTSVAAAMVSAVQLGGVMGRLSSEEVKYVL